MLQCCEASFRRANGRFSGTQNRARVVAGIGVGEQRKPFFSTPIFYAEDMTQFRVEKPNALLMKRVPE